MRLSADADDDRLLRGVPQEFNGFHWHGDIFDLPRGAVALASSDIRPIQAFRYGDKVYGFLCHLEVSETSVHAMVREFTDESKHASLRAEILANTGDNVEALSAIAETVFGRWAGPIQGT